MVIEQACHRELNLAAEKSESPFRACTGGVVQASALYIVEVDPTSLLRFTGHTDKNNVRIFEGDTVKWKYKRAWVESEHVSKVVWDDFYNSWKLTVPGGLAKFRTDVEYEVVRNCYSEKEE